jgi:hypothetical protein
MDLSCLANIDISGFKLLPQEQEVRFNIIKLKIALTDDIISYLSWHDLGNDWCVKFQGKLKITLSYKENKYKTKYIIIDNNQIKYIDYKDPGIVDRENEWKKLSS